MKFYTVNEVAEMLSVHPETIRRNLKSGKLKGHKVGKDWRVEESAIRQFLTGDGREDKKEEE